MMTPVQVTLSMLPGSSGANTWLFDVAATEIASGAVPGEPAV